MRHAFVLAALRVTRRQADTKQVQLPKTARSRVPLLIFFIGVITPGNSPVGRGGMMRGRIQSGTPHKNGVGHLFPDLRLVESASPYPTMN